jgi:hypothetical protein
MTPETQLRVEYLARVTDPNCHVDFTYADGAWACQIIAPGASVLLVGRHPDPDSAFAAAVEAWWPKMVKRYPYLKDRTPFDFMIEPSPL